MSSRYPLTIHSQCPTQNPLSLPCWTIYLAPDPWCLLCFQLPLCPQPSDLMADMELLWPWPFILSLKSFSSGFSTNFLAPPIGLCGICSWKAPPQEGVLTHAVPQVAYNTTPESKYLRDLKIVVNYYHEKVHKSNMILFQDGDQDSKPSAHNGL